MASTAMALALGTLALAGPASASASTTHAFTFSFEPLVGSQSFSKPISIATDAAGNVYVMDDATCRISKWDANGNPVNFSALGVNTIKCPGGVFSFAGRSETQIAVAPPGSAGGTAGDIYVASVPNSGPGIDVYAADGTHIGQLTEADGSALGTGACGVAVDPAGNVYVGDSSGQRIVRYVPSANPPTNADYDAQITGVGEVCNVAADSNGDVYASTPQNGPLTKYPAAQFGGAGSGTQITAESGAVGIDPTNDDVYVAEPISDQIAQFDSSGNLLVKFGSEHLSEPRGVAVYPAGDVFVGNRNGSGSGYVSVFASVLPAEPPAVSEEQATDVNTTNAILRAQLDPNRENTTYHFEYTDHADFLINGFANATSIPAPEASAGSGNVTVSVFQPIGGLLPDATYDFRLLATNGTGTTVGSGSTFTTYSSTPIFGPCPNDALRIGPSVALPDCRAYERVSPLEKSGFDVEHVPVIASRDGDAVSYPSLGAFSGAPVGAYPNTYFASRTDAWATDPASPPVDATPAASAGTVLGTSGDFSKQLVISSAQLTLGAVSGQANVYVHDRVDGSYEFVATSAAAPGDFSTYAGFAGASEDGSHFFFSSVYPLASSPPPPGGEEFNLYEFSGGQLELVGVLPDGTVSGGVAAGATHVVGVFHGHQVAYRPVSDDGQRVYWMAGSKLYLRENGQSTLVSERQSDSSTQAAILWYASRDGSLAYLTSNGRLTADASAKNDDLYRYDADSNQLTDLTPDNVDAQGAQVHNVLGASEDGAYVYFTANGALAPGAVGGSPSLYVWHDGETRLIGGLASKAIQVTESPELQAPSQRWRISPDGRYLGFLFSGQLTGPHAHAETPYEQAYLYDYEADSLACASCLPGGADATADARLQGEGTAESSRTSSFKEYMKGLSRNVSNAGQFFFETSDRLVGADSNGKQDVYEYEAGHVYLISTGRGENDSYFGDASPSGDDVFFLTREKGLSAVDQDNLIDLYDARVGGGLGGAAAPPPCEGDACASPRGAPNDPTPASASYHGAGNPAPKAGTARCRKGRKLRAGHCVKAKKKHKRSGNRAAHANRGGSK